MPLGRYNFARRGFSLAEVLVALSILVVGMVGVLDLLAASRRINAGSLQRLQATALAEGKLEILRKAGYAALRDDATREGGRRLPVDAPTTTTIEGMPTHAWQVALDDAPGLEQVWRVSVAVSWGDEATSGFAAPVGERVTLTTLIAAPTAERGVGQ